MDMLIQGQIGRIRHRFGSEWTKFGELYDFIKESPGIKPALDQMSSISKLHFIYNSLIFMDGTGSRVTFEVRAPEEGESKIP